MHYDQDLQIENMHLRNALSAAAKTEATLKAENAKLQERVERAMDKTLELAIENAELRELALSLYKFSVDEYPDGTELNFADKLRELRIEVAI